MGPLRDPATAQVKVAGSRGGSHTPDKFESSTRVNAAADQVSGTDFPVDFNRD